MAKKDKQVLPPSGAGLVRYFEEETKGPKLTPEQVVINDCCSCSLLHSTEVYLFRISF